MSRRKSLRKNETSSMSVLTTSFGNGIRSLLSIYGIGTEEFQADRFSDALLIQVRRLAWQLCKTGLSGGCGGLLVS